LYGFTSSTAYDPPLVRTKDASYRPSAAFVSGSSCRSGLAAATVLAAAGWVAGPSGFSVTTSRLAA
jgi:hypothetical protein